MSTSIKRGSVLAPVVLVCTSLIEIGLLCAGVLTLAAMGIFTHGLPQRSLVEIFSSESLHLPHIVLSVTWLASLTAAFFCTRITSPFLDAARGQAAPNALLARMELVMAVVHGLRGLVALQMTAIFLAEIVRMAMTVEPDHSRPFVTGVQIAWIFMGCIVMLYCSLAAAMVYADSLSEHAKSFLKARHDSRGAGRGHVRIDA